MVRGIGRMGIGVLAAAALMHIGPTVVVTEDSTPPEPREPKQSPPADFNAEQLRVWRGEQTKESERRRRQMERRAKKAERRA